MGRLHSMEGLLRRTRAQSGPPFVANDNAIAKVLPVRPPVEIRRVTALVTLPEAVYDAFTIPCGFIDGRPPEGPQRDDVYLAFYRAVGILTTTAVWREAERRAGRVVGRRAGESLDAAAARVWLAYEMKANTPRGTP